MKLSDASCKYSIYMCVQSFPTTSPGTGTPFNVLLPLHFIAGHFTQAEGNKSKRGKYVQINLKSNKKLQLKGALKSKNGLLTQSLSGLVALSSASTTS